MCPFALKQRVCSFPDLSVCSSVSFLLYSPTCMFVCLPNLSVRLSGSLPAPLCRISIRLLNCLSVLWSHRPSVRLLAHLSLLLSGCLSALCLHLLLVISPASTIARGTRSLAPSMSSPFAPSARPSSRNRHPFGDTSSRDRKRNKV